MSKTVNKEEASILRKQGLTYKQIADTIGCSVDWCKKNLKDVEVDMTEKEKVITELTEKARTKEALTKSEIRQKVIALGGFEDNMSKTKFNAEVANRVNNMQSKITKQADTIVRPSWMNPYQAVSSYHTMAKIAEEIDNKVDECLNYYLQVIDIEPTEVNRKSLLATLAYVTQFGTALGVNPVSILENYDKVSQKLVDKNGDSAKLRQDDYVSCVPESEVPY